MRLFALFLYFILPVAVTAVSATPELELQRQANWFAQDRAYSQQLAGVVNDLGSGLIWQQKAPEGQVNWRDATDYCASLTLSGLHNWRLPSRLELLSLLNYDNPDSAYDSLLFSAEPPVAFWSGTVYDNMPSHVWIAQFGEGDMYCLMRVAQAHVRCVS